ncbi:MAG: biotin--[acetyl-CoA-carboxylase] ligase [Deltaproteobacteria bacterium]|nr:MAG: biotin--[acetyl-CoA-carboxylase] ligase [Deltaproteobacteria bacterium]
MNDLRLPASPRVILMRSTTSTNDEARRLAGQGAPDGTTVIADFQTRGRGRLGRTWHAPAGRNLNMSQVVRGRHGSLGLLPMAAGLAVQATIGRFLPYTLAASLKWPNDVIVMGFKLAGILAEIVDDHAAVLGIGVNINTRASDFPTSLRRPAASVMMLAGRRTNRSVFTLLLLEELDRYKRLWQTESAKLVRLYTRRCGTLGKSVSVNLPGERIEGTAISIDPDGALVVRDEAGNDRRILAGDVVERPARK